MLISAFITSIIIPFQATSISENLITTEEMTLSSLIHKETINSKEIIGFLLNSEFPKIQQYPKIICETTVFKEHDLTSKEKQELEIRFKKCKNNNNCIKFLLEAIPPTKSEFFQPEVIVTRSPESGKITQIDLKDSYFHLKNSINYIAFCSRLHFFILCLFGKKAFSHLFGI